MKTMQDIIDKINEIAGAAQMTTQKLDFDIEEFYENNQIHSADATDLTINCLGEAIYKLKQLCQAVDAINDNKELLNKVAELSVKINILNSSLREFEKQKVDPLRKRIDAINDRLEFAERALANYREYKIGIEDLETDVMYLTKRIEKLEGIDKKECDEKLHPVFYRGKECKHDFELFMLDNPPAVKCKLCGYIKVFGDMTDKQKTECKHDLHLWNDYYQKCNNCEQLFRIRESENLKSDAEQHTIDCHAHKGGLCNCSLEKKQCDHDWHSW